jgi:hypothetical protein
MNRITKKQLDELVGGDFTSSGSDINIIGNREIQTGPIEKPYNDDSTYEKGIPTFTDVVFARYRQNIPWFAVYSFGGSRTGGITLNYGLAENKNKVLTKENIEEIIEDLVKRKISKDEIEKDYNPDVEKVLDKISDLDLSEKQIEELLKALEEKKNNPSKTKNI